MFKLLLLHTANSIRIDRIQIAFIVHRQTYFCTNAECTLHVTGVVYKIRMSFFCFFSSKTKIKQEACMSTEMRSWKSPFGKGCCEEKSSERKLIFFWATKWMGNQWSCTNWRKLVQLGPGKINRKREREIEEKVNGCCRLLESLSEWCHNIHSLSSNWEHIR